MSGETNEQATTPFNKWWWISGGFLLAIVVAGIVVVVAAPSDEPAPAAPGAAASTGAPQTSNPTAGCDLAADDVVPTEAPETEWVSHETLLVPASSQFGPVGGPEAMQDAGWGCFAHSPTGALFASANFVDGVTSTRFAEFVEVAAVQNEAADAWVADHTAADFGRTPGRVAQLAGFQFGSVEPDRVTVRLLFSDGTNNAVSSASMVWDADAGTWLGDLSTPVEPQLVDAPSGFTTWGGV
ncbi:hypothetical protein [Isoptericola sp. NPDC056134]|uniref:hypothetical protein n=1 Tax=Isoptericola sp. NPDC056134 TaxID=3345723 RepID=UPI0035E79476